MPQIPQYRIPGVAPDKQPPVYQPLPANTGVGAALRGAGAGLAHGLNQLQVQRERLQDEHDAQQVLRAQVAAREALRPVLYDPQGGVLFAKGGQATGATQKTTAFLDELHDDLTESFSDRQQQAFAASWGRLRDATLNTVAKHEATEFQTYKRETAEATIAAALQDAAAGWQSEGNFGATWQSVQDAVTVSLAGVSAPETVAEQLRQAKGKMRRAVLDQFIVNRPADAKAYFEKHRTEFLPTDSDELQKQVQDADVRGRAELLAVQIYDADESPETLRSAIRAADAPQAVKDNALARVNQWRAEDERQKKQRRDNLVRAAWQIVERDQDTDTLTREMRTAAAGRELDAMEARAANLRQGIEPTHDPQAWAEFMQLGPEETVALGDDLWSRYVNRFDRRHMEAALARQAGYRDALAGKELKPQFAATLNFGERTLATARRVGLVPAQTTRTNWTKKQALRFDAFEAEAAERVQIYELTELGGKRKASGAEIQQVLDEMALEKVRVNVSWGRDVEVPAGAVLEDEQGQTYVPYVEIPEADALDVKRFLDGQGVAWDRHTVERAYAATRRKDRAALDALLKELSPPAIGPRGNRESRYPVNRAPQ